MPRTPIVTRLDLYTAVHKMQRARLFRLTADAGTTDPGDSTARARLAAAVGDVVAELTAHAAHEDRFIHPLLRRRAPDIAGALDAAHIELDARLATLRSTAATYAAATPADPNSLYRALAAFTAAYLDHLACEEGEAMPVLWDTCRDDELFGVLQSFLASRSATENLASVIAQLATLNPPEIVHMVGVGLDPAQVPELAELLATVLRPDQLGALRSSGTTSGVAQPRSISAPLALIPSR